MFDTFESKHSLLAPLPIPKGIKTVVIGTYCGGPRGGGALTRPIEPHWKRTSCACGWYFDGEVEMGELLVRRHIKDRKAQTISSAG